MSEQYVIFLFLGGVILGGFIFLSLLLEFGDYIKCKECGKWHDMYDVCFEKRYKQ
mgnify:CR=1 FL=1